MTTIRNIEVEQNKKTVSIQSGGSKVILRIIEDVDVITRAELNKEQMVELLKAVQFANNEMGVPELSSTVKRSFG